MNYNSTFIIKSLDIHYSKFSDSYILLINKFYKIEVKEWLKFIIVELYEGNDLETIYKHLSYIIGKSKETIQTVINQFYDGLKKATMSRIFELIAEGRDSFYIKKILKKDCELEIDLNPFYNNPEGIQKQKIKKKNIFLIWDWNCFSFLWKILDMKISVMFCIFLMTFIPIYSAYIGLFRDIRLTFVGIQSQKYNFIMPVFFTLVLVFRFIYLPIHEFGHEYFYRLFTKSSGSFYVKKTGLIHFSGFTTTDDILFIKSKVKRCTIGFSGVIAEIELTLVIYILLKVFNNILTESFFTIILYYLILRLSLSIFTNLNFLLLSSDGYQIIASLIDFPTLKATTVEYLQSIIANRKMSIAMNKNQKKLIQGYVVFSTLFLILLVAINLFVFQAFIFSLLKDPMTFLAVNKVLIKTDIVSKLLFCLSLMISLVILADYLVIVLQQRKKITHFFFLLKVRHSLDLTLDLSDTHTDSFIGNFIIMNYFPNITAKDIPDNFRIILIRDGVKNLAALDTNRTFYENRFEEGLVREATGLTLTKLALLANKVSFNYIKGDFFEIIPYLKECLIYYDRRMNIINYTQNFKSLKRKEIGNQQPSQIELDDYIGTYVIFNITDIQLDEIPKDLQILLMGDGVRNGQLISERTSCCSHCAKHRNLKCSNYKSYLELTEIIASYDFFILQGFLFQLAMILIDAIITLQEFKSDESSIITISEET